MARLPTIKSRVAPAARRQLASSNVAERRITGRALQDRRLRLWELNPHCAICGRLVAFPHGFELDHAVPLFQGGTDTDENCQILCVYMGRDGHKAGCHLDKTREDINAGYGSA